MKGLLGCIEGVLTIARMKRGRCLWKRLRAIRAVLPGAGNWRLIGALIECRLTSLAQLPRIQACTARPFSVADRSKS